jgi:predicted transcriptional regulator
MNDHDTADGWMKEQAANHAATIVSAALHANAIRGDNTDAVQQLYSATYRTAMDCYTGATVQGESLVEVAKPSAAEIRKSVKPAGIVSFIDGKVYRTLKRHLSKNGFTPESYRTAYGLPADYPMVAADYSAQRSSLAKEIGLGRRAAGDPADPVEA